MTFYNECKYWINFNVLMFSNRQIERAILHFFPNFKVERSKSNQGENHAERHPYVSSILNRFACASFEKGEEAMKEGRIGISFAR